LSLVFAARKWFIVRILTAVNQIKKLKNRETIIENFFYEDISIIKVGRTVVILTQVIRFQVEKTFPVTMSGGRYKGDKSINSSLNALWKYF
jgi:hypothetical protein